MIFTLTFSFLSACGASAEPPVTPPATSPVPPVATPPEPAVAEPAVPAPGGGVLPVAAPTDQPATAGEPAAGNSASAGDPAGKPKAQVDTLLGKVDGVAFVGDWTSPPCGGRTYARNIRFESDQEYGVMELVSPCPVGTTCVWSGLATFAGLWDQQGPKLILQEIGMTKNVAGGPHPVFFESTADGRLVENGCFYTKGLTVPPGYTEEKVRPKLGGPSTTAPKPPASPAAEAVPAK